MKQKQKQQEQKDVGKEWAALTTWLRMNLHNVSTAEAGVGHPQGRCSWLVEGESSIGPPPC